MRFTARHHQGDGCHDGPAMSRYGSQIFWLEGAPHEVQAPLQGTVRADVVIVGGGFTGLWTAYELKLADPSIEVVILEAEEIAFGASGRNGGFAMTLLDMSLHHLLERHGAPKARAAHQAVAESVTEIGKVCELHGIDCDFHHGGLLVVSTNPSQERRVQRDVAAAEAMGLASIRPLSKEEVRAEVRSPTYLSGLFDENCAVLDPARLSRGLKDVVMAEGVRIFEGSPVTGFETAGTKISASTQNGCVEADQLVLATNAWASRQPQFKRKVVPLYTYVILTEPLSDETWDEIGWANRQGIEDKRNYVHYYRRTADGRILWGGRDGVVYARDKISPAHDANPAVFAKLAETLHRTFPQTRGARITHRWGGPIAITSSFVPLFGSLEPGRVHYGLGYNGHGVAPSHLGGRILSDLVLDNDRGYGDLLFVDAKEGRFPPEPLTWLGAEFTRRVMLSQDRKMDAGKDVGDMDPLVLRITNRLG
jgi:glycine/D-amino acid oxidase-like deaminating enzyme